jgi:hypothetical protein
MKYTGNEKRRFIRIDTLLHVLIRVHSDNWEEILHRANGTVLNLSKDSLFVKTKGELLEGNRVSFLIYSKHRKIQYLVKGIISQKRESSIVVMATDFDPPDIVITDFLVDDMERSIESEARIAEE